MLIKRIKGKHHDKRFKRSTHQELLDRKFVPKYSSNKSVKLHGDVTILYSNPITSEIRSKQEEILTKLGTDKEVIFDECDEIHEGFVYLISNPKFPGWIKIGMTINLDSRLSVYQTSDPDREFQYEVVNYVSDRRTKEFELLNLYASNYEVKGEWVKIDIPLALNLFKTCVGG